MSRATHFVGTADLPQEADPPADGRRFRVGPTPDIAPVYADSIIERLAVDRQVQAAEKPRPR
jgi:hypothetical protein